MLVLSIEINVRKSRGSLGGGMKSSILWDITRCSPMKLNRRFRATYCFHIQSRLRLVPAFTLICCWTYYSTLKMEAICSSETSVHFPRTTLRYIPEDSTLRNQCTFYLPLGGLFRCITVSMINFERRIQ
jgi:hypothetical protein